MAAAPQLYLDTARLGCMKPSAGLAVRDFARLASRGCADLYGIKFLKEGFRGVNDRVRDRYPGVRHWEGIESFKKSLCQFANVPANSKCLLSSRSSNLMRIAAKAMTRRCRRVLTLDLYWEPFQAIAQRAFRRANIDVSALRLRSDAVAAGMSATEVTTVIVAEYFARDCDGILLPTVSHDGIRLPVDKILRAIKTVRPETFAIVDGAQAFAHVGTDIGIATSDMFLCGAHKWLGAGMPLGIAFVTETIRALYATSTITDPLAKFVEGVEHGTETGNETVNVWPLFACYGALQDAGDEVLTENAFKERRWNSAQLRASLSDTPWEAQKLHPELSSGIEVFRPRRLSCGDYFSIRSRLGERGVAASIYSGPRIRISMPGTPLSATAIERVRAALAN